MMILSMINNGTYDITNQMIFKWMTLAAAKYYASIHFSKSIWLLWTRRQILTFLSSNIPISLESMNL